MWQVLSDVITVWAQEALAVSGHEILKQCSSSSSSSSSSIGGGGGGGLMWQVLSDFITV